MKALPLFFNLSQEKVLIIGGGKIALRKATSFHEAGAFISVISPEILPDFEELTGTKLIRRKAVTSDISKEYRFVILATNDEEANGNFAKSCKEMGIFCCRSDNFCESDFFTVSTINRSAITAAIYSSGVPEMSKFLKKRLDQEITPEIEILANILAELRPLIKKKIPNETSRKALFAKFLNQPTLSKIAIYGQEIVKEEILKCL